MEGWLPNHFDMLAIYLQMFSYNAAEHIKSVYTVGWNDRHILLKIR